MKITEYTLPSKINRITTIALVSDLHDRPFESIRQAFSCRKPDIIAIAGDLADGQVLSILFRKFISGE